MPAPRRRRGTEPGRRGCAGCARPEAGGADSGDLVPLRRHALIFVIFALSLNLFLGFAGQVSVAHAAFGAIGGYAVGYLTLTKGWNFVPALLVGVAIAFAVGTSSPSRR